MTLASFHHLPLPVFIPLARASLARSFVVLLAGCGEAVHSLGELPTDITGSLGDCGDGVVIGSVVASRQEQIAELAGCQEVTGDLTLGFPEMDLRPLGNLRIVRGNLHIQPYTDGLRYGSVEDAQLISISSLAGLEALERVGGLRLQRVQAADLSALRRLSAVEMTSDNAEGHEDAALEILECAELRDLSGLENLRVWSALTVQSNPQLETLAGLAAPASVDWLYLGGNPVLMDVSALHPVKTVTREMSFQGLPVERLDGFQLYEVQDLRFHGNPNLTDLRGFSAGGVTTLRVHDNPVLETMPELTVRGSVFITGNAGLRHLPPLPTSGGGRVVIAPGSSPYGFDTFELGGNANLETAVLPGLPSSDATVSGARVAVYGNPLLRQLELNQVRVLFELSIDGNASLETVQMNSLRTVDALQVTNNPGLAVDGFAELAVAFSMISGNLPSSPPPSPASPPPVSPSTPAPASPPAPVP